MTIEAQLEQINDTLLIIANALITKRREEKAEDEAAKKPAAKAKSKTSPTSGADGKSKTGAAAASAKPSSKTAAKSTEEPTKLTKEDVRTALQALQKSTDASTAKAVLQTYGATTLGTLDTDNYAKVIEACVNGTK